MPGGIRHALPSESLSWDAFHARTISRFSFGHYFSSMTLLDGALGKSLEP